MPGTYFSNPIPPPPPGVPLALQEATNTVLASWVIERINMDIDRLTTQIIEMTEKRDELYKSLEDIEVWLKERHKVILVRQHGIRTKLNPQTLFTDIKTTYEAAAARYINPTRRGAPLSPDEISPENVIGAFYLYVKQIKEMVEAPIIEEPMTESTPTIEPTSTTAAESSPKIGSNRDDTHTTTPLVDLTTPLQSSHLESSTNPLDGTAMSSTFRVPNIPPPRPQHAQTPNLDPARNVSNNSSPNGDSASTVSGGE